MKAAWTQKKADALIALVAIIWGSSYLLMKVSLTELRVFTIISLRFGLAFIAAALIFCKKMSATTRTILIQSAILGFALFSVFAFLLHGLTSSTATSAGFLTSTTVIFVPVFHSVLLRKLPDLKVCISILLTFIGIALLTIQASLSFHPGDALCLCGAASYACHILLTDRFAQKSDPLLLGIWQLGFAGFYGLICSIGQNNFSLPASPKGWIAILGLAFLCSAFGFIAQPVAQKHTTPEHTGLLFALEPVSSAIFSSIFLGERLNAQGCIGAALILFGVVISSVFSSKNNDP